MKLPALWILAGFAAGIGIAERWPASLKLWAVAAALGILIGGILAAGFLAWRYCVAIAWTCALVAWLAIGGLAASVERATIPANHIARLIAAGRVDTSVALRWRGRLREDPLTLPWGQRFEIDLEQVESQGAVLSATGGLRVNFYPSARIAAPPAGLRAGDRVEVLVKARPPRNYLDPGAFDVKGFLAREKIDVMGSLRSGELLQVVDRPAPTILQRLARARGMLLALLDSLFAGSPERGAVARAMLLGDRSFVDSSVVLAFQKTAAYHVLVVAGLHVGALVIFLWWLGKRLRFSMLAISSITLLALAAYVGIVQDRPPILRAALMAGLYLCARPLFRRVELLNSIAIAALILLLWKPSSLADSSFQLSFLAAGVIAGLALPWMERSSAPYRAGLNHLGDVTRDTAHAPKIAQFRIEMRAAVQWLANKMPARQASRASALLVLPVRAGLRLWEIILLSAVIQCGMLPLLAQDFHRVSLAGPMSNVPAVLLTAIIVPLGFVTLGMALLWARVGLLLAKAPQFLHRVADCDRGMVRALAAADVPDSRTAGVAGDCVLRGIYFSGGGGARNCRATTRPGEATAMAAGGASCGVDCDAGCGCAGDAGGVASICAGSGSRKARSERAGRGAGRFDFCGVSGWTHDGGGRRRAGRSRSDGRLPHGAGCGRGSGIAVFVVTRN